MGSIVRRIIVITLLVAAGPATAATWYVDQATGDDDNDGMSAETPFATVNRAFDAVEDLDVVLVGPGVYGPSSGETLPLTLQGLSVTILGAGSGLTILDGEGVAQVLSMSLGDGRLALLSDLSIVGGKSAIGAGLIVADPGVFELQRVRFVGNEGSIGGAVQYQINRDQDAELIVRDCKFEDNTASIGPGIHVQQNGTGTHSLLVDGSSFRGHNDPAIAVSRNNGGGLVTVRSSIIDAGPELAISVPVTGLEVLNSTLIGTGTLIRGSADLTIINSILFVPAESRGGRGSMLVEGDGGLIRDSIVSPRNVDGHELGANVTDVDPLLTPNQRLTASSPAIDAGDNSIIGPKDKDIDGGDRIVAFDAERGVAGIVDLGADELDPRILFANGFEAADDD